VEVTWLIIAAVLVLAFGPIMWLLPSKKDRRLTRLRTQGRLEGLNIDIVRVKRLDADPTERVTSGGEVRQPVYTTASYALSFPRKLRHLQPWRILKSQNGNDPLPGWVRDTDVKSNRQQDGMREDVLPDLTSHLADLPDDIVAVELSERSLICYWLELAPADAADATGLKHRMDAMAGVIREREKECEAPENFPPDS
jgi:hypothetical protein